MQWKKTEKTTDTDEGFAVCKNVSGATLVAGSVVILDITYLKGRNVTTTTSANAVWVRGIVKADISAASMGDIICEGVATVNVKTGATAIAVGDPIATYTTAGKAGLGSGVVGTVIGRALAAVAINTEAAIAVMIGKC